MRRLVPLILLLFAFALLLLAPARAAEAPGAILLWPVNPVIEGEDRAAALWLENPGKAPVTLQVAVYGWAQPAGKNAYAPQQEIVATPPIVTIPPGARQLIRLTRTVPPPAATEHAYRVIVDEIPVETRGSGDAKAGAAVSFRMRYSLPLFAYAKGAGPAAVAKAKAAPPAPRLAWRIAEEAGARFVEIRNDGPVHARLTAARLGDATLAEGLLGYVLPGSTARWPLPSVSSASGPLVLSVDGAPASALAPLDR